MTTPPRPQVRSLLLCEDVIRDPVKPKQISLIRLISSIRVPPGSPRPVPVRPLCVFAQLTECRGAVPIRVDVYDPETGAVHHTTPTIQSVAGGNDPLAIRGVTLKLGTVVLPGPGLYAVRLWVDAAVLAEYPLVLK